MIDFTSVSRTIADFLEHHPKSYSAAVPQLQKFRDEVFTTLVSGDNPVLRCMAQWDEQQLAFVIVEYSAFSNEAIHMLLDAMIRNHDWPDLKKEIEHNIAEEKGEETRGVPHLEMMRQGYRVDLRLETDNVVNSYVTRSFLEKMRNIFRHDDNAYSAGALLAFEGTAIAEFRILDSVVRRYKELLGEDLRKGSLTNMYIDGHKDFEIGHEAGLRDAIAPYIDANNIHRFIRGYFAVCLAMSVWWEHLAIEACYHGDSRRLKIYDTEYFDVNHIFQSPKK